MTSKLKLLMDQYDRTINSKLEEENNLSVAMESMETNNLEEKKCEHLHVTNWICDKCGVDTLRERRSEVLSPSDKTWEEKELGIECSHGNFIGWCHDCPEGYFDYIKSLLTSATIKAKEEERRKHALEVNRILNLHSKPISEGGLDYVKAFEEMERYEHRLFNLEEPKS